MGRACRAGLTEGRTRDRGSLIVREVVDDLDAIDYKRYYSSVNKGQPSGADQARYADFSGRAARAAQAKLREFLAIMPPEDLRQARLMAAPPPDAA